MIKSSTALKARIKNKVGGDSDKSQLMLRVFFMERLLERISVSRYKDNFILKGGLLVSSLTGVDMRSTMDVDTTVRSIKLDKESAQVFLKEILSIDLGDNVYFYITKVQEIMEGHEYEGIRVMIDCVLDKISQIIKVDISTGDVITPGALEYKYPLIVEDRTIDIWVYNLETLLAEKLETIMVRADSNTRMRDFYDIFILLRNRMSNIDQDIFKSAFLATCRQRKTEKLIETIDNVIASISVNKAMVAQWSNYKNNNYYVGELSWNEVMESVRTLGRMAR